MKELLSKKDLNYLAGEKIAAFKGIVLTEDDYEALPPGAIKDWKGYSFKMTYEVVSEESAEMGDVEDRGWEYKEGEAEDYDYLEELLDDSDISGKSWVEWSSYPPNFKRDWLISEGDQDYSTGDTTTYNLWIYRKDGQPLSRDEGKFINKKLGIR